MLEFRENCPVTRRSTKEIIRLLKGIPPGLILWDSFDRLRDLQDTLGMSFPLYPSASFPIF